MESETKSVENDKVQVGRILIPIDDSECSLKAAKYAARIAKDESTQLFCIHFIVGIPYGTTRQRTQQISITETSRIKFSLGLMKYG